MIVRLTPAEERLLPYIKEGLPYAEIAARIGISLGTCKNQVYKIGDKVPPDPYRSTYQRIQRWIQSQD